MRESKIPNHIAFIVDGNRRWARKKGLPAMAGHKFVVEELLNKLIEFADNKGIKYLTFWVFSTENWKRGQLFARGLFALLKKGLNQKAAGYVDKGYKFKVIGDLEKLPTDLADSLRAWQEKSRKNKKIQVTIAINYGGRDEIIRGIKKMMSVISKRSEESNEDPLSESKRSLSLARSLTAFGMTKRGLGMTKTKITKEIFGQYLDTAGMPDPDLIIRTGGECRLSGFLLWQSEYSELYFTETLFPDFDTAEFEKALEWYSQRQRRFGK